MDGIKRVTGSRFGFACISNIITILISLVFFRPFWEETDDVFISMLPEGAYGVREPHLIYPNYIYGKLLCFFQSIIPAIRWNAVFQYLFLLVAFTAIVYIIAGDKRGRFLSVMLLLCGFYEVYVTMQYSKTSAVIATVAYLVIFGVIRGKNNTATVRGRLIATALICIFYSIILRRESFLLATLIAGAYGICVVIGDIRKGELGSRIGSYCRYFLPVFALFALTFFIDSAAYGYGEWAEFRYYDASRIQMTDFHHNALLYGDHKDELEALGLSENDAFMLITWQFGDKEFVTSDLMNRISAIDKRKIDTDLLKAYVADVYNDIPVSSAVFVGLVLLTGLFAVNVFKMGESKLLTAGYAFFAVITFAVLFYYEYSCRWSHRVVYALLVPELLLLIFILADIQCTDDDGTMKICTYLLLIVIACYQRTGNEFEYRKYDRTAGSYDELTAFMENNKDTLFVADTFTMQEFGKYDVFTPVRFGQFDNLICVGAWTTNSPVESPIAKKFGYSDPFDALASRSDSVILIDDHYPERKVRYLNEHKDGGEYELVELESVGNISLYSIK